MSFRNGYLCLSVGIWIWIAQTTIPTWWTDLPSSPYMTGALVPVLLLLLFVIAEVTVTFTRLFYYRHGLWHGIDVDQKQHSTIAFRHQRDDPTSSSGSRWRDTANHHRHRAWQILTVTRNCFQNCRCVSRSNGRCVHLRWTRPMTKIVKKTNFIYPRILIFMMWLMWSLLNPWKKGL